MLISSPQNDKIKSLIKLYQKSSFRNETGLFVVEGQKEVKFAINGGFHCEEIFFKEGYTTPDLWADSASRINILTKKVFSKVAYRFKTEGIVGVFRQQKTALSEFVPRPNDVFIILDQIEKPGNIGAILRTCDALGINGLINLGGDLYSPNTIRSSVGCLFHIPTSSPTWSEVVDWILINRINVYVSHMDADKFYDHCHYQFPAALVVGSEAKGVGIEWNEIQHEKIKIRMKGVNDSLNVSVAAALLLNQISKDKKSS